MTDPDAVVREADATRRRGYAIEHGEYRPGLHAVAVPVRDRAGAAIAAVGVSGQQTVDHDAGPGCTPSPRRCAIAPAPRSPRSE